MRRAASSDRHCAASLRKATNCSIVGGVWSCTSKLANWPLVNGAVGYGSSGQQL
jgi:hypothetical protein